jgi:NADPH2:quinone reductase
LTAVGLRRRHGAQPTRFGGPQVLDVVDVPVPEAGPGQQVYDVSTAGVNDADPHHLPVN